MRPLILLFSLAVLFAPSFSFAQEVTPSDSSLPGERDSLQAVMPEENARATDGEEKGFFARLLSGELSDIVTAALVGAFLSGIITFVVTRYQIRASLKYKDKHRKKKERTRFRTATKAYEALLREELGTIKMVGVPDLSDVALDLPDVFVHLRISEEKKGEDFLTLDEAERQQRFDMDFLPNEILPRAFTVHQGRVLLIVGDPGSGKSTLLKHFALSLLDNKQKDLGLKQKYIPVFFPLRKLQPEKSLPDNLAGGIETHKRRLNRESFHNWLNSKHTLVLLDGLDEISEIQDRIEACRWIARQHNSYPQAAFIVTSRSTGYRKSEGVELSMKHLRVDIQDFTPEQQAEFLRKWFRAAYLCEDIPREGRTRQWRKQQLAKADNKIAGIHDFLERDDNHSLRQLAGIPMILQIMAIIWKEKDYLPRTRLQLYQVAMDYLLEYRDQERELDYVLPAKQARSVLAPVALWLQEERKDEVRHDDMHDAMQPHLQETDDQPAARVFCDNLVRRAGILAEYGDKEKYYIFRHKSFREYLAAQQMVRDYRKIEKIQWLLQELAKNWDWWQEPLRFMVAEAEDATSFDLFMQAFFNSEVSKDLGEKQRELLTNMVREASRRKPDALVAALHNPDMTSNQQRYILDCLKVFDSDEALQAIKAFHDNKLYVSEDVESLAEDILYETESIKASPGEQRVPIFVPGSELPQSFRNANELNAEYIYLPAGTLRFSLTDQEVSIPDMYVAKYPVTNKRYRRFINYLEGNMPELKNKLPVEVFAQQLISLADKIEGYDRYLGKEPASWPEKLRSARDRERNYDGDDQPVVTVSWYAARAYCLWLTLLHAADLGWDVTEPLHNFKTVFRLPLETEWERAAAGTVQEGGPRLYPWPEDKGKEPTGKLANFNNNVGYPTPVGQVPDGATPEGLADMAGNVWEWQANLYSREYPRPVVRGGAFLNAAGYLRCSYRFGSIAGYRGSGIGFRVVLSPKTLDSEFSVL